ncbi:MAG: transglutaminase family protein [Vicinamibacterales bacterium]
MGLLTVRHLTVYRYSEPVEFGEHRMMFRPRESHDLRLLSTRLEILPRPSDLRWLHDVFDNSVAIATFDQPARELRFDSTVTLEHIETALPDYALEIGAHTYPFQYSDDERPDLVNALARHYPCDDLGSWTARFLSSSGPTTTMTLLHSMTRGIKEEFVYVRRREKGVQSPAETLRRHSGSCRDFAVLMMEAARSLGLAARFVSGYIFVPDANRATSVGGGSTHGWMQAYLPGAGWVDFDPTNSIVGNRNLIRVAVAWNQQNALPLWGTFSGPASAFCGMEVDVSVIEETQGVP